MQYPKSVASISINEVGSSVQYYDFRRSLIANNAYFEMYTIVSSLLQGGMDPLNIYFMANQEISNETYYDLQEIVTSIYSDARSVYDERLVLPYDGRLLWIDALSYYLSLCEGMESAIIATQRFFFNVIAYMRHFKQGSPKRERFMSFLRSSEGRSENILAKEFANYYSSFAIFAKNYSSKEQYEKNSKDNSLMAIELLDRAVLEFSNEDAELSIKLFSDIYRESQVCSLLDICIETIIRFFEKYNSTYKLKETTIKQIAEFQTLCMSVAYQWMDITLLDKLVDLQKSMHEAECVIKYKYKELFDDDKIMLFEYFKQKIEEANLMMEDVVMCNTIFLSYTHADNKIADEVDNALRAVGLNVKRDKRDVGLWDDLQGFMKSIRKQDYAVFLVSDEYLHSINCLYEVMQFMKDDDFASRGFPIAIEFSEAEKQKRRTMNKSTNMFSDDYWIDIINYWEEFAINMEKKLKIINLENSAELSLKYRTIKGLAQTAAQFFGSSFACKLLATISPDDVNIENIVRCIENKISSCALTAGNC